MGDGRAHRDHGDSPGRWQTLEQGADLCLVPARRHEDNHRAGRWQLIRRRGPFGERHPNVARQERPEVAKRIAQPDDEQRDIRRRRHFGPSAEAVTKTTPATARIATRAGWPVVITSPTTTTLAPEVASGKSSEAMRGARRRSMACY